MKSAQKASDTDGTATTANLPASVTKTSGAPQPRKSSDQPSSPRATIRTYRHGLGDCHLITLHGRCGAVYRILIDCGVILGTPGAAKTMINVMDDVVHESGGRIDLLVATHEHWDHLSGFVQARTSFEQLKVDKVWMGWTENLADEQAMQLRRKRDDLVDELRVAAAHMQLTGSDQESNPISSILEFFGAAGRLTTKDALEVVRSKTASPRYCDPQDPPTELSNFDARIYVLGPPRDEAKLKKILPSKNQSETYNLAMVAFQSSVLPGLNDKNDDKPFNSLYSVPDTVARELSFFQQRYWNDDAWRRVDVAWMADATQFALALDSMTNNTSLVLAIELDEVGVLLFAADAQVGNWLSWSDLKWSVAGCDVSGPDLLKRTVLYKVGHHGSYNATLREHGLELMQNLRIVLIPVDHDMAVKRNWGSIPLNNLLSALGQATQNRGYVLRTDEEPPADALARGAKSTPLYFEVQV